jgi:hypothetical protein
MPNEHTLTPTDHSTIYNNQGNAPGDGAWSAGVPIDNPYRDDGALRRTTTTNNGQALIRP